VELLAQVLAACAAVAPRCAAWLAAAEEVREARARAMLARAARAVVESLLGAGTLSLSDGYRICLSAMARIWTGKSSPHETLRTSRNPVGV
jgi:hypothetical protein